MFGSYQKSIEILSRMRENQLKLYQHNQNQICLHYAASLSSAIEALEVAEAQESNEHAEWMDQYFKCQECGGLKRVVTDLNQFFEHGTTKELCKKCSEEFKINKLV